MPLTFIAVLLSIVKAAPVVVIDDDVTKIEMFVCNRHKKRTAWVSCAPTRKLPCIRIITFATGSADT